jgi:hypothetical protein
LDPAPNGLTGGGGSQAISAFSPAEQRQLSDLLRKVADAEPTLDHAHRPPLGSRHMRSQDHAGMQPPVEVSG